MGRHVEVPEVDKDKPCTGCAFYFGHEFGCQKPDDSKFVGCSERNIIFKYIEDEDEPQPEIKLVSALDISLVDGLLTELTQICEENNSRIKPYQGESIRDFYKRLIYQSNQ